jgi:hypothetical protein
MPLEAGIAGGEPAGIAEAAPVETGAAIGDAWVDCARVPVAGRISIAAAQAVAIDRFTVVFTQCPFGLKC